MRHEFSMSEKLYNRCLTLKARLKKLDNLFFTYVEEDKFEAGYCQRIIDAKDKCRNELGIYLGILL